MLKHAKGNLLDMAYNSEFDVVVQGCNCFNAMGGGIAKEIAERFPKAQWEDRKTIAGDYKKLGNYTQVEIDDTFIIVNAYTQYQTSKVGEDVFEYNAFALILQKLEHEHGTKRIGLPYIGMGLAGGKKEVIIPMIEYFAKSVSAKGGTVTLVEFG